MVETSLEAVALCGASRLSDAFRASALTERAWLLELVSPSRTQRADFLHWAPQMTLRRPPFITRHAKSDGRMGYAHLDEEPAIVVRKLALPIVVIVCMVRSSESWEPQQRPHPWHRCAGGGAVHSINNGSEVARGHLNGAQRYHQNQCWMKSRISAIARSGASGITACPQLANRSN